MFPDAAPNAAHGTAHDDELQTVLHALAHPVRRFLLGLLRVGGTTAGDLSASAASKFDVSTSRISQHLRVLAEAGLVDVQADGQQRFYSLRPGPARMVPRWIQWLESAT